MTRGNGVAAAAARRQTVPAADRRFERMVVQVYPVALRWARRLYPRDAEDLVQEAFARLAASYSASAFPANPNCLAWLGKVMQNAFLSMARKRRVQAAGSVDPAVGMELQPVSLEPRTLAPYEMLTGDELRRAVASLSDKQRDAYQRSLTGKSYDQMARELGISRYALAKRLHDARARLEKILLRAVE